MAFKSNTQPLCRACGKPIKKRTTTIWVYEETPEPDSYSGRRRHVVANPRPTNKAECQRLANEQVLSITRWTNSYVSHFNVWDGESYDDAFFCSGSCAQSYAYMCVKSPTVTIESTAYRDAMKARRELRR